MHEDTPLTPVLLGTPGTVDTDNIEYLPVPQEVPQPAPEPKPQPKPKPKYGGDEVALTLAAEMHQLEAQVQDLREKAEKAEERAMKWEKIRSECSQNHQQESCQFAQSRFSSAQSEAQHHRMYMVHPEKQIAIMHDILAQFTDEDGSSETEAQPV
jgi:hypothetical protein